MPDLKAFPRTLAIDKQLLNRAIAQIIREGKKVEVLLDEALQRGTQGWK